ncbi:MAG: polymer-forming cytoskeletal protein [Candidatus Omnitrophica bacterium]|nr:polymer-forming cytoskeletal protein [Candidatus Omnitrophota bacterium]
MVMPFRERKKEQPEKEPEEKVIDISVPMKGNMTFGEPVNLRINGDFAGTLTTHGTLTISQTALVDANITGENIVIAGKVKGNVIARKMLVLMPTAIVTGDISTPKLNIVEGAVFQGKCHMMEDYLTVDELAQYLEIEEPAIVELASTGKIPAFKEGEAWRFERVKIDSWAAAGKVQ